MIQESLKIALDARIVDYQYGNRRGRSTAEPNFTTRRTQDIAERHGTPFYLLALDYSKLLTAYHTRNSPRVYKHECFFQCILYSLYGPQCAQNRACISWLRRVAARRLQCPDMSPLLVDAAQKEGLTPRLYVKALKTKLWGGTPEATALAQVFGTCIEVQTQYGSLISHWFWRRMLPWLGSRSLRGLEASGIVA